MTIASYIDHTLLSPRATHKEIEKICREALDYSFAAVCIPPQMVKLAREIVLKSKVKVVTVISFPFGWSVTKAKLAESEQAISDGADELDVVFNLADLKNGNWKLLENEMKQITELIHGRDRIIKVIIESGMLTDDEIMQCCKLYGGLGVDFLKTSTGFAEKGATTDAVMLMKKNLPSHVGIKASGGIRNFAFARQLIQAGATRLGCSASIAIVESEVVGQG